MYKNIQDVQNVENSRYIKLLFLQKQKTRMQIEEVLFKEVMLKNIPEFKKGKLHIWTVSKSIINFKYTVKWEYN